MRAGTIGLAVAAVLQMSSVASSADFTVNVSNDSNDPNVGDGICGVPLSISCSLRAAIQEAMDFFGSSEPDTIHIPVPGTYTLDIGPAGDDLGVSGDLDFFVPGLDLRILGAGSDLVTIEQTVLDRVLHCRAASQVFISGVTITGGDTLEDGAGILVENDCALRLDDVVIEDNHTLGVSGGMVVDNGSMGSLGPAVVLTSVTIAANSGHLVGSAGVTVLHGQLAVQRSLIEGNNGHGIWAGTPTLWTPTEILVVNSTLSHNALHNIRLAGGVFLDLVNVTLAASPGTKNLVLNPVAPGDHAEIWNTILDQRDGGDNCDFGLAGTIFNHGVNLESSASCNLFPPNLVNTNPLLQPLADNGGLTSTQALAIRSAAIDAIAGDCADPDGLPVLDDQRGFVRPALPGGDCDIGAYEAGASPFLFADGFESGDTSFWSATVP